MHFATTMASIEEERRAIDARAAELRQQQQQRQRREEEEAARRDEGALLHQTLHDGIAAGGDVVRWLSSCYRPMNHDPPLFFVRFAKALAQQANSNSDDKTTGGGGDALARAMPPFLQPRCVVSMASINQLLPPTVFAATAFVDTTTTSGGKQQQQQQQGPVVPELQKPVNVAILQKMTSSAYLSRAVARAYYAILAEEVDSALTLLQFRAFVRASGLSAPKARQCKWKQLPTASLGIMFTSLSKPATVMSVGGFALAMFFIASMIRRKPSAAHAAEGEGGGGGGGREDEELQPFPAALSQEGSEGSLWPAMSATFNFFPPTPMKGGLSTVLLSSLSAEEVEFEVFREFCEEVLDPYVAQHLPSWCDPEASFVLECGKSEQLIEAYKPALVAIFDVFAHSPVDKMAQMKLKLKQSNEKPSESRPSSPQKGPPPGASSKGRHSHAAADKVLFVPKPPEKSQQQASVSFSEESSAKQQQRQYQSLFYDDKSGKSGGGNQGGTSDVFPATKTDGEIACLARYFPLFLPRKHIDFFRSGSNYTTLMSMSAVHRLMSTLNVYDVPGPDLARIVRASSCSVLSLPFFSTALTHPFHDPLALTRPQLRGDSAATEVDSIIATLLQPPGSGGGGSEYTGAVPFLGSPFLLLPQFYSDFIPRLAVALFETQGPSSFNTVSLDGGPPPAWKVIESFLVDKIRPLYFELFEEPILARCPMLLKPLPPLPSSSTIFSALLGGVRPTMEMPPVNGGVAPPPKVIQMRVVEKEAVRAFNTLEDMGSATAHFAAFAKFVKRKSEVQQSLRRTAAVAVSSGVSGVKLYARAKDRSLFLRFYAPTPTKSTTKGRGDPSDWSELYFTDKADQSLLIQLQCSAGEASALVAPAAAATSQVMDFGSIERLRAGSVGVEAIAAGSGDAAGGGAPSVPQEVFVLFNGSVSVRCYYTKYIPGGQTPRVGVPSAGDFTRRMSTGSLSQTSSSDGAYSGSCGTVVALCAVPPLATLFSDVEGSRKRGELLVTSAIVGTNAMRVHMFLLRKIALQFSTDGVIFSNPAGNSRRLLAGKRFCMIHEEKLPPTPVPLPMFSALQSLFAGFVRAWLSGREEDDPAALAMMPFPTFRGFCQQFFVVDATEAPPEEEEIWNEIKYVTETGADDEEEAESNNSGGELQKEEDGEEADPQLDRRFWSAFAIERRKRKEQKKKEMEEERQRRQRERARRARIAKKRRGIERDRGRVQVFLSSLDVESAFRLQSEDLQTRDNKNDLVVGGDSMDEVTGATALDKELLSFVGFVSALVEIVCTRHTKVAVDGATLMAPVPPADSDHWWWMLAQCLCAYLRRADRASQKYDTAAKEEAKAASDDERVNQEPSWEPADVLLARYKDLLDRPAGPLAPLPTAASTSADSANSLSSHQQQLRERMRSKILLDCAAELAFDCYSGPKVVARVSSRSGTARLLKKQTPQQCKNRPNTSSAPSSASYFVFSSCGFSLTQIAPFPGDSELQQHVEAISMCVPSPTQEQSKNEDEKKEIASPKAAFVALCQRLVSMGLHLAATTAFTQSHESTVPGVFRRASGAKEPFSGTAGRRVWRIVDCRPPATICRAKGEATASNTKHSGRCTLTNSDYQLVGCLTNVPGEMATLSWVPRSTKASPFTSTLASLTMYNAAPTSVEFARIRAVFEKAAKAALSEEAGSWSVLNSNSNTYFGALEQMRVDIEKLGYRLEPVFPY